MMNKNNATRQEVECRVEVPYASFLWLIYSAKQKYLSYLKKTNGYTKYQKVKPIKVQDAINPGTYSSLPNKRTSRISVQGGILTKNK